ncbi:rubredoxin [Chromobacterium alticapitis]|nr:rubredoxin [Chromobacterium alticapitis]
MNTTEQLYLCEACGMIYDPTAGLPEAGIAPGTTWEGIPDNWRCPECGVAKQDFVLRSF